MSRNTHVIPMSVSKWFSNVLSKMMKNREKKTNFFLLKASPSSLIVANVEF